MKICIELVCLIISSIVGVGFLTGAEIFQSFAQFGKNSIFGISVLFVLFFALVYKILSNKSKIKNLPKMQKNNIFLQNNTILNKFDVKNHLVFLNVFLMSAAMFSGLKTIINKLLFNNNIVCYLVFVLLVFFVLQKGVSAIKNVSFFVVGFLIFVFVVLAKNSNSQVDVLNKIIVFKHEVFGFKNITLSIVSAGLYVFMNIVQIQPVIDEYEFNFSKKKSFWFTLVLTLMFVTVVSIFSIFLFTHKTYCASSMPVFELFKNFNVFLKWLFVSGVLLGLFSTLLSCLTGVKRGIQTKIKSNLTASFLAVLATMCFGFVDFSFFVSIIYPVIGVVNIIIYLFL